MLADIELAQTLKSETEKAQEEMVETVPHPLDQDYNSLRCRLSLLDTKTEIFKVRSNASLTYGHAMTDMLGPSPVPLLLSPRPLGAQPRGIKALLLFAFNLLISYFSTAGIKMLKAAAATNEYVSFVIERLYKST